MTSPLIIIGALIIIGLSAYAASLLVKLRRQTQQLKTQQEAQHTATQAREKELLGHIHYIAAAMLEERCELSEGVMRIGKLFELLGQTEHLIASYPSLFTHFELIKEHPIMEQRKALAKQQRMRLDLIRMKSETALEADINREAQQIVKDYSAYANA